MKNCCGKSELIALFYKAGPYRERITADKREIKDFFKFICRRDFFYPQIVI